MSARGRKTRLIGSSTSSNGGHSSSSPWADCSPDGTRSGTMPHSRSAAAVTPPTAAILSPANARASSPNSSNFSRTALHGVDRGEADPLVAAGDQALDRALHLLGRARRLDRDGRDDLGGRAEATRAGRSSSRTAPWCGAPGRSSRTAAWSRTRTALAQGHGRAHDGQRRELQGLHDLGDLTQGGDAGGLPDAWCRAR